ncbi:MAG: hypothetical protein RLZ12_153 [Bacillota bacterium]|jgi:dUTP pyrophosphatase
MYTVEVLLVGSSEIAIPQMMTSGASGFDLKSSIDTKILAGSWAKISTGIALKMPDGLEAQVRPRGGLALKAGLTVLNTPGTIDADYRGEIFVLLLNLGPKPYEVKKGNRIAQLVFQQVPKVNLQLTTELESTARGTGAFGHTGI